jgi:hypothetical protein
VRLEGLGQLKNPLTSVIEPATFRLVACASTNYPKDSHLRTLILNRKRSEDIIHKVEVVVEKIQHFRAEGGSKLLRNVYTSFSTLYDVKTQKKTPPNYIYT